MAKLIKQSTANDPLFFFLTSSTDHIAALTGATATVTISKNGAAFAAPAGAVTEIANGWYQVAGNATDTNTLGDILLHATATGADPCDMIAAQVVAFDPRDSVRAGLTALPNAAANAVGGLPVLDANSLVDVDVKRWLATAVTAATAGIPDVNVKNMNNVSAASITTINANQGTTQPVNFTGTAAAALVKGDAIDINSVSAAAVTTINANIGTTQPINFTGTGAAALAKVDVTDIAGVAVNTGVAQLGVNVVNWGATAVGSVPPDTTFLRSGTAQGGGATSITLDAGASATDNLYDNCVVFIRSGTGAGQANVITAYNGTTKVATVGNTWATNPDATSVFTIWAVGPSTATVSGTVSANVVQWNGSAVAAPATAGIPDVNVKNINNVAAATPGAAGGLFIAGTNAATTITSASGNALTLSSTGANGHGLAVSGNGTGDGIQATGGATGRGGHFIGGATSGAGLRAEGTAGNSNGIEAQGQGSADGLAAIGGATGRGIHALGGATSGAGFRCEGVSNSQGLELVGNGTGDGLQSTGGATGRGAHLIGGVTSGAGLRCEGTIAPSPGIEAVGAAAVSTTAAGPGMALTGGAASTGVGAVGAPGLAALGGAGAASGNGSAPGATLTAGSTTTVSGNDGAVFSGTGNGNGLTAAHAGTGKDLNATTSPPLQVNAIQLNGVTPTFDVNNLLKTDVEDVGGAALATHAAGMVPADVRDIAGSAVSTTTAQLGVNAVQYNGQTTQTDANGLPKVDLEDIGGVVLGAHAAGMVPSDVRDIAGAAVSPTSAQLGVNVVQYAGAAAAVDANNLPKIDVEAVNGNTTAAQNVSQANQAIGRGTCTTGGTTTSIPTSAFAPGGAGIVAGQFIGRVVIFDANTVTASLRGQATVISNNTSGATPTFTVTALTTAPANNDTFGVY